VVHLVLRAVLRRWALWDAVRASAGAIRVARAIRVLVTDIPILISAVIAASAAVTAGTLLRDADLLRLLLRWRGLLEHRGRRLVGGGIQARLDKILALGLSDERLQFCSGEGVDETGLAHDEEQDLCACEGREFVGLQAVSVTPFVLMNANKANWPSS